MSYQTHISPNELKLMKKVNVVGTSGSGKSTFGKMLASRMSAKYIGLDELHWLPHWQGRETEDLLNLLKSELECEAWVLDGNYTKTREIKWKNVDAVIWIDLPFWKNFQQVLWRSIKRSFTRKELWPGTGNVESFGRTFFSKDSILWWMITTHSKNRKKYEEDLGNPTLSHLKFIRLRSRRDMKDFLDLVNP